MIREEKERQQTQQKAKEPMAATGVTSDEDPELEAMNSPAKPAPGTSEKTASPKKKVCSNVSKMSDQWLCARLRYLLCIISEDTAVLQCRDLLTLSGETIIFQVN